MVLGLLTLPSRELWGSPGKKYGNSNEHENAMKQEVWWAKTTDLRFALHAHFAFWYFLRRPLQNKTKKKTKLRQKNEQQSNKAGGYPAKVENFNS